MDTAEAKWYLNLIHVEDKVGKIGDLQRNTVVKPEIKISNLSSRPKPSQNTKRRDAQQVAVSQFNATIPSALRIVEIDDEEADDDLIPYAKPDSDPEDEDEDPTLVQRNKPKPPV